MIDNKKVLVLIPARGGSKGLPGKNIRNLCGKPLLGWPIHAAKYSKFVDRIIVSTEDELIAGIAKKQGAEVPFLRPQEYASDTATSFSVIHHALDTLEKQGEIYEYCVFLEPTSPLTETEDIDKALEDLHLKKDIADSIVGVSQVKANHPVFDVKINKKGLLVPYQESFSKTGRRQDIELLFFFEGSLYISKVSALLKEKGFYHKKTLPYIVPKWKAFEIDDMVDFNCVESIIKNIKEIKGK